jgi:hypothetical protein
VAEPFKLNVKLGAYEFSAEGPEESVREQYKSWLDVVAKLGSAPPPSTPSAPPRAALPAGADERGSSTPGGEDHAGSSVPEDVMKRVYLVDPKTHSVSLRVLPTGGKRDAEALLLLLYGFAHYFHEHGVLGTQLMKAARVSGVQVDRADRVLDSHSDKLTVAGFRKGRTYGLNNPGKAYAEKRLSEILQ